MKAFGAFALSLMLAAQVLAQSPAYRQVNAAELAVYAAYLQESHVSPQGQRPEGLKRFVLRNEAAEDSGANRQSWERYLTLRVRGAAQPLSSTVQAFLTRPRGVVLQIYSFPSMDIPVILVRSDVLDPLLAGDWSKFWATYPDTPGVLSFSGVGFDPSGSEAMLTSRLQCGARCGYRNLAYLKKDEKGAWRLVWRQFLP